MKRLLILVAAVATMTLAASTPALAASVDVSLTCSPSGQGFAGSWTYPTFRPADAGWYLGYQNAPPYALQHDACSDNSGPLAQPDGTTCAFTLAGPFNGTAWPTLRYRPSDNPALEWNANGSAWCDGDTHCFLPVGNSLEGTPIEVDCDRELGSGMDVLALSSRLSDEVSDFSNWLRPVVLLVVSYGIGVLALLYGLSWLNSLKKKDAPKKKKAAPRKPLNLP